MGLSCYFFVVSNLLSYALFLYPFNDPGCLQH
jgi:hypothetical protein